MSDAAVGEGVVCTKTNDAAIMVCPSYREVEVSVEPFRCEVAVVVVPTSRDANTMAGLWYSIF